MEKVNFWIILAALILGVVAYDYIQNKTGISYFDEIIAAFMLGYYFFENRWNQKREFIYLVTIFIFYLIYSLLLKVTVPQAVMMDFSIQIKPYIAFYCSIYVGLKLDEKYKYIISRLCLFLSFVILVIGLSGDDNIIIFFSHPSRFATAISILGLLYLYSSQRKRKDIVIMFFILTIGLLSLRSKFIGFYVIALILFFLPRRMLKFEFSIKTILVLCISVFVVLYFTWDKLSFYFILGYNAENMFARPLLYLHSIDILKDYFPFGSGFGTYATHASAEFYSPLYSKYHLNENYEIGNGLFISDAFLPSLAQYGFVGIALFIVFWKQIIKRIKTNYLNSVDLVATRASVLIFVFFAIEFISDSTFTHNRGMVMLMILAMLLNEGDNMRLKDKKVVSSKISSNA